MARKVARIGLHYAQDRGTLIWVYNLHQADCTMFLDGSLGVVLAYARQHRVKVVEISKINLVLSRDQRTIELVGAVHKLTGNAGSCQVESAGVPQ